MTPAHERLYLRTLHELVAAKMTFCIIGTFALRWQFATLAHWPIRDCDLMLPADPATLNALVVHLQAAGWEVTQWEEPVHLPLTAKQLQGKYYLRARQQGAVLDCSYENDLFNWPEFAQRLYWHNDLPLACPAHSLLPKALRNTPADQAVIRLCV